MKKNVAIFIMLGLVGLVCSQLEGLTRKEFAKLRQLEKQLDARIKEGVQGISQNWFAESDAILQKIKQLDPQSSIPFEKKLTRRKKLVEQKVTASSIQSKIKALQEAVGFVAMGRKEAEKQAINLDWLWDEINGLREKIVDERPMIGEDNYVQLTDQVEKLDSELDAIILAQVNDVQVRMQGIANGIPTESNKGPKADFSLIEQELTDVDENIAFLELGLLKESYNKLQQEFADLNIQLAQTKQAVQVEAQKIAQFEAASKHLKDGFIKRRIAIDKDIEDASASVSNIQMQVDLYKNDPPAFLFTAYLKKITDLFSDINSQEDKLGVEDFNMLNKSIQGLVKDLALNVYENANNLISNLKNQMDAIKGVVQKIEENVGINYKNLTSTRDQFKKNIEDIENYLIIANQKGLLLEKPLSQKAQQNQEVSDALERFIEDRKSVFSSMKGYLRALTKRGNNLVILLKDKKEKAEKLEVVEFNQVVLIILMIHDLVELYKETLALLDPLTDPIPIVDEMEEVVTTLKTSLYQPFGVKAKNGGITMILEAGLLGSTAKADADPLKGIGPTIEEIAKKQQG